MLQRTDRWEVDLVSSLGRKGDHRPAVRHRYQSLFVCRRKPKITIIQPLPICKDSYGVPVHSQRAWGDNGGTVAYGVRGASGNINLLPDLGLIRIRGQNTHFCPNSPAVSPG